MTHDGCGDALRASSPHTHQGRAAGGMSAVATTKFWVVALCARFSAFEHGNSLARDQMRITTDSPLDYPLPLTRLLSCSYEGEVSGTSLGVACKISAMGDVVSQVLMNLRTIRQGFPRQQLAFIKTMSLRRETEAIFSFRVWNLPCTKLNANYDRQSTPLSSFIISLALLVI